MATNGIRLVAVGGSGVGLLFRVPRTPEAGETVIADSVRTINGGKASNHAIGAARLGARAEIITAVGNDVFARMARDLWHEHGVSDTGVVAIPGASTMVGTVVVDGTGDNRITIAPGALALLTAELVGSLEGLIASADVCLVSLEIPVVPALEALSLARHHKVLTILNPAPAPPREWVPKLVRLADVVTPNQTEASAMTGLHGSPESMAEALLAYGARSVAITLGAAGALYATSSQSVHVRAVQVARVVDTAGAGDAFNAALAVALAKGRDPLEAIALGCEAGARIVQGPGFVEALDTWTGFSV